MFLYNYTTGELILLHGALTSTSTLDRAALPATSYITNTTQIKS